MSKMCFPSQPHIIQIVLYTFRPIILGCCYLLTVTKTMVSAGLWFWNLGGGVTKLFITFDLYGLCLYMIHIYKGKYITLLMIPIYCFHLSYIWFYMTQMPHFSWNARPFLGKFKNTCQNFITILYYTLTHNQYMFPIIATYNTNWCIYFQVCFNELLQCCFNVVI